MPQSRYKWNGLHLPFEMKSLRLCLREIQISGMKKYISGVLCSWLMWIFTIVAFASLKPFSLRHFFWKNNFVFNCIVKFWTGYLVISACDRVLNYLVKRSRVSIWKWLKAICNFVPKSPKEMISIYVSHGWKIIRYKSWVRFCRTRSLTFPEIVNIKL